jgi:hypothetical protein
MDFLMWEARVTCASGLGAERCTVALEDWVAEDSVGEQLEVRTTCVGMGMVRVRGTLGCVGNSQGVASWILDLSRRVVSWGIETC